MSRNNSKVVASNKTKDHSSSMHQLKTKAHFMGLAAFKTTEIFNGALSHRAHSLTPENLMVERGCYSNTRQLHLLQ